MHLDSIKDLRNYSFLRKEEDILKVQNIMKK